MDVATRLRGCLLAGGVGDALGAPLEFLSLSDIHARWGPLGPEGFVAGEWPAGTVTDDTQMTLFTAEGMIRARTRGVQRGLSHAPGVVYNAYLRWLHTQGESVQPPKLDGWLSAEPVLNARRAPGTTCLTALRSGRMGTVEEPLNDSKGCGTVMRMAPAGLWDHAGFGLTSFQEGRDYGAITHGHPSGYLASGVFARGIAALLGGAALADAIGLALRELDQHAPPRDAAEVRQAVEHAVELAADTSVAAHDAVPQLGQGWVAEEALAIGIYCALTAPDLWTGLRMAVAHGGDSDSTGAIAGNLLGAVHGPDAIPDVLLQGLDARSVLETVAHDLNEHFLRRTPGIEEADFRRYPGV